MKYLIALALLVSPAMAADLPLSEPLAPVKVVAKPTKVVLTKGKGKIIITCTKTCSAIRTESGMSKTQKFGHSNLAKLVKEARAYGWK